MSERVTPRTKSRIVSYCEISSDGDSNDGLETSDDEDDSDLYHDDSSRTDEEDDDASMSNNQELENNQEGSASGYPDTGRDITQAPMPYSHSRKEHRSFFIITRAPPKNNVPPTITTNVFCTVSGEPNDPIPIPTFELFDVAATNEKIVQDINIIAPLFSPDDPLIHQFIMRIQKRPFVAYTTPKKEASPTTWTSTDPVMDAWWLKVVNEEPRPRTTPDWLPADQSARVKPTGDLNSPFMVITGYPLVSAIHPSKLGYHTPESALNSPSMLHFDALPVPIDRTLAPGDRPIKNKAIKGSKAYWYQTNNFLMHNSQSKVALVLGATAHDMYLASLWSRKIFSKIYAKHDYRNLRPIAILELNMEYEIQRIAILAPHPEM
ncbi:hypothetical protein L13192_00715 [Pyrenophora tritici-repentis]|nr:hypothetical protein L13192_00715 [Pyrenophora tritici-repentis]KAI1688941.1 hypothetical protein KJE20_02119 [Pyrenophora tritici-repentis]